MFIIIGYIYHSLICLSFFYMFIIIGYIYHSLICLSFFYMFIIKGYICHSLICTGFELLKMNSEGQQTPPPPRQFKPWICNMFIILTYIHHHFICSFFICYLSFFFCHPLNCSSSFELFIILWSIHSLILFSFSMISDKIHRIKHEPGKIVRTSCCDQDLERPLGIISIFFIISM